MLRESIVQFIRVGAWLVSALWTVFSPSFSSFFLKKNWGFGFFEFIFILSFPPYFFLIYFFKIPFFPFFLV